MKTGQTAISADQHTYDALTQRCLTFLRCWPLAELRRLEIVAATVRKVVDQCSGNLATCQEKVIRELRQQVKHEVVEDELRPQPPLNRKSMAAVHLRRVPWQSSKAKGLSADYSSNRIEIHSPDPMQNRLWIRTALWRRLILAFLVFVPALLAAWGISTILPYHGSTWIEKLLIVVSGLLFAWISVGFWVATFGAVHLLRGKERYLLGKEIPPLPEQIAPGCRSAILFPICGEDMSRVSAGVFSVYQSLLKTGQMAAFDIFLLSDSSDPDAWVNEEVNWRQLNRDLGDPGNLFYRRRRLNLKRKSGNVADFCRRFGANYRYMIVFDADSVMSGTTLVRMVQLMEHHPHVGILQTPPAVVGRETLLARMQQFAGRAYGPIYAAGLHSIQLGDGSFWGHNAILRIAPFMKYCSLPRLPGSAPWGGDILSHDFVESALMRRAGWSIWLAYDLEGSYEEPPPTLLDELKRDRRWCSGNMQHLRLMFTEGLSTAHRWLFLNGVMSYFSAALWMLLLLLSSAIVIMHAFHQPDYFPSGQSLFPQWPVWDPFGPVILLMITAILLFLPKILALIVIGLQKRTAQFGGWTGLLGSLLLEVILSACLAPVRMLFHTRFILMLLLKRQSGWHAQNRNDSGTSWLDALHFHLSGSIIAVLWGGIVWLINPLFFVWLTPILLPLLLAAPISVWTSRLSVGRFARKLKIFLIPEEVSPPLELVILANKQRELSQALTPLRLHPSDGFVRAVLNPQINALHRRLNGRMTRKKTPAKRRFMLLRKALSAGPEGLSIREKKRILHDSLTLWLLHKRLWAIPEGEISQKWFARYAQRAV